MKYFLYGILCIATFEIAATVLMGIYLTSPNGRILFWLDALTRLAFNLSSVFLIQIPLFYFYAKSNRRYFVSYLIFALAAGFFALNLTLNYQPYLDAEGIIYWQSPLIMIVSTTILAAIGWIPAGAVFMFDYLKSGLKSVKSLLLSLGFLLGSAGVILQDYVKDNLLLNLLYLLMVAAAVLVFFGFVSGNKAVKKAKS